MKAWWAILLLCGSALGTVAQDAPVSLEDYFKKSIGLEKLSDLQKQTGSDLIYRMTIWANRRSMQPLSLALVFYADETKQVLESGKAIVRVGVEPPGKIDAIEEWIEATEMTEIIKLVADEEVFNLPENEPGRDDRQVSLLSQASIRLERWRHDGESQIVREFETDGPVGRVRERLLKEMDRLRKPN